MIVSRHGSAARPAGATSPGASDPGRVLAPASDPQWMLARWEAATALMLACPPTADASVGLARMLPVWFRWREHPVGALIAAAARHPQRTAIIDDEGTLTFAQLEARSNALAGAWRSEGIGPGTTVGVLCRDGRLFLDVAIAAQKLGANLVYLHAAFSAPQVAGIVADEGIDVLACGESAATTAVEARPRRVVGEDEVRRAVAGNDRPLQPPARPGRTVVFTSGTMGRPKAAVRQGAIAPMDGASLLAGLPLVSGDTTVVATPLSHGFGIFGANLALALNSTVILRSKFDPQHVLTDIAEHRAAAMVVVPERLQRLLTLPMGVTDSYDTSSLRVVLCGGDHVSGALANEFMDRFGDILYNVYGSTEAGFATVASPRDLRNAPGTAGRPTPGMIVRIVDGPGRPVRPGTTGRVLVGSNGRTEGDTGSGGQEIIDGLVVTGDVGHMDRQGRLFIDGRDADTIVPGGENVFPAEIEEVFPPISESRRRR